VYKTYTETVASENLIDTYTFNIQTLSVESFQRVESMFVEAGFNREEADVFNTKDADVVILNTEAGFGLSYNKALFGDREEELITNGMGVIIEYVYTFEKAPSMEYRIRTKSYAETSGIDSLEQVRSLVEQGNGTIISDLYSPEVFIPGYDPSPSGDIIALVQGKRVFFEETGSPDIPSVYAEVNEDFDVEVYDDEESRANFFWDIGVQVFPPGADPDTLN